MVSICRCRVLGFCSRLLLCLCARITNSHWQRLVGSLGSVRTQSTIVQWAIDSDVHTTKHHAALEQLKIKLIGGESHLYGSTVV